MHGMAQPTFPLYDRILGGNLADLLTEWRTETPPASTVEMAFRLRELGVSVHPATVKRWLDRIDTDARAAS